MTRRLDLFNKVKKVVSERIEACGMQGKHLVVALSGGADSVALLSVLAELRDTHSVALSALHVHHGIRAREADEDVLFCEALCETLGVPLAVVRVDVPSVAKERHLSMESAAREVRYECFERHLAEEPETYIVTAHHADDNAETVLFRMARGTGLRGLCGIPPMRDRYLRPCLGLTREDMVSALAERGITYRTDSTNADTSYTRNFIRHEVIPVMKHVHEGTVKNISLMTEGLREDEEYLMGVAEGKIRETPRSQMRSSVAGAHTAVAKRMLWMLYEKERTSPDAMTAEQMNEALAIVRGDRTHALMTLPGGVEMYIDRELLSFRRAEHEQTLQHHDLVMGKNVFPETGECLILSDVPIDTSTDASLNIYKLLIHSSMCFDTMDVHMYVRGKADGDAYRYGGMMRSLKTLYNGRKLSLRARLARPLVCDEEGILWVPGFGIRENAKKDDADKGANRIYMCYCGFSENE